MSKSSLQLLCAVVFTRHAIGLLQPIEASGLPVSNSGSGHKRTIALAAHHKHAKLVRHAKHVQSRLVSSEHSGDSQADSGGQIPGLLGQLQRAVNWTALGTDSQKQLRPALSAPQRRVAFIFMVNEGLEFSDLWEEFFAAADPQDFKILVHASTKQRTSIKLPPRFSKELVPRVESSWCHLTRAQFSVMRLALKDPSVGFVIWLSADAVPVKSLGFIHSALMATPQSSHFCVDDRYARAEMWNTLARRHAESLLAEENTLFKAFHGLRQTDSEQLCEDEDMFYAPLRLLGMRSELVRHCFMWTDWDTSAVLSSDNATVQSKAKHRSLLQLGPASKANWLDVDWLKKQNSNYKVWGGLMHPWTFVAVPAGGMRRLLRDPKLWFARKFSVVGAHFGGGVFDEAAHRLSSIEEFLLHEINFNGSSVPSACFGESEADCKLEQQVNNTIGDVNNAESVLHSAVASAARLARHGNVAEARKRHRHHFLTEHTDSVRSLGEVGGPSPAPVAVSDALNSVIGEAAYHEAPSAPKEHISRAKLHHHESVRPPAAARTSHTESKGDFATHTHSSNVDKRHTGRFVKYPKHTSEKARLKGESNLRSSSGAQKDWVAEALGALHGEAKPTPNPAFASLARAAAIAAQH